MDNPQQVLKVGYVVKMFPRLSETFILNEILELERRGVEVVIFSAKKPNEGRFHPQLSALKAEVLYLEDQEPKKWPHWIAKEWESLGSCRTNLFDLIDEALSDDDAGRVDQIWWSAWLASQALKRNLDHLHAHFASLPSSLAYFAHRISRIPFSFTAHAKDIFVYTMNEHYLREKLAAAAFIVTVTHFNHRYLCKQSPRIESDRIKVIHNGINLEQFVFNPDQSRQPNRILAVGRLVVKKGFDTLLEACHLLKKDDLPFTCLIVGEGPEAGRLKQQCRDLRLDEQVTFTGAKNLEEVRQLMQTSTLFCLPCTVAPDGNQDALPTVLLEALASGLPILSTTVSGIPEIVDHETDGLLVGPDDRLALSEQLRRLLTDSRLRKDLAMKGRTKAEKKFDLRINAGETLLSAFRTSARAGRTVVKTTLSLVNKAEHNDVDT